MIVGKPSRTVSSLGLYLLRRTIVLLLAIVAGVYITVLLVNKEDSLDKGVQRQVNRQLRWMESAGHFDDVPPELLPGAKNKARWRLEQEVGLWLPRALRHLRWTWNALTFQWGRAVFEPVGVYPSYVVGSYEVNEIILQHFPNTLLVMGSAYLLTFCLGIPLALYLASRKQGHWLDRLFTMLAPISSVPSWVLGILLVAVFAVQLRLLPYGGKYDALPAETWLGNFAVVAKHMVLPVLSAFLAIAFQLVYSWRAYLVIHSAEDYVDLAKAKGLNPTRIERRYILRPTLPYLLTGFALTLVGFWQMTAALEYVFRWPGIGQLYLASLPYFIDDFFYAGEMSIVVSLVVIFAYLLAFTVLLLDLVYAWVDPRIRLTGRGHTISPHRSGSRWQRLRRRFRWPRCTGRTRPPDGPAWEAPARSRPRAPVWRRLGRPKIRWSALKRTLREIARFPSAIAGLALITVLAVGSAYAVVALPYLEIGESWHAVDLTGKVTVPKNAPAKWVNWFRRRDLPGTVIRSSQEGTIEKVSGSQLNGDPEIVFTMDLDYPHEHFPQDVLLYFSSSYKGRRPHASISWTTPDGREIRPKSPAIRSQDTYRFSKYLDVQSYLRRNEHWRQWFVTGGPSPTPSFYVLFAQPEAKEATALPGKYRLVVTILPFGENTDVDIEFVLIGRVHGWAGTDHLRRDLLVPLLWGLPFALAFGLGGATVTTVLAMVVAAAGAWFGGWVDSLVQRLTEVNLILPILAIGVLLYTLSDISLWTILSVVIALNVFGSPTKTFRAAFLQAKEEPYIESARAYGAGNLRIIMRYLMPRIVPTLIPQIVALIPSMVFLEATLSLLGVYDPRFPTWGKVIRTALVQRALWGGSSYWVLEPIGLLLLTALAFVLLGFGLEAVLNPRLRKI
jgi:peptide/nickel transport system permease protein